MQNLDVVSHTVWAHIGGPKNLEGGGWAPAPLDAAVAHPLETRISITCYHAKFGHSRSNRASVINGNRQKNLTHHVPLFKVTECQWN